MAHWSRSVQDILLSRTGDLKELAQIAGLDWRTVYRGQSFKGCDLSGQDLRGIDFTGSDLSDAKLSDSTLIDPMFDPRYLEEARYRIFRLPLEVNRIAKVFARDSSYTYVAWAFRNLLERFVTLYRFEQLDAVLDQIRKNEEFNDLVSASHRGRFVRRKILVEGWKREFLDKAVVEFPDYNVDALAIFSGALVQKNYRSRKYDLSSLSTSAIWPPI